MNKKIENDMVEVVCSTELNDRDYLNIVLELEKNMSNNYSISLNEASNDTLYSDYFELFEDIKETARELYQTLFKNGWYSLEEADKAKINEAIANMESSLKELVE
ncbi:MAG: spore coat protein [Bacilli bacterium]